MEFTINMLAVVATSVANLVIGFLWYGPLLGKFWVNEMGFTLLSPEQRQKMQAQAMWAYPQAFLGGLLMNYVFAYILQAFHGTTIAGGLMGAFWMWIGFIVPVKNGERMWSEKSLTLFAIDTLYYAVTLSVAAIILISWK